LTLQIKQKMQGSDSTGDDTQGYGQGKRHACVRWPLQNICCCLAALPWRWTSLTAEPQQTVVFSQEQEAAPEQEVALAATRMALETKIKVSVLLTPYNSKQRWNSGLLLDIA